MAWIALKLIGLRDLLAGLLMHYPREAIIFALVLLAAWLWRTDAAHVRQRDAARAQIESMAAASKAATARLKAQRDALERSNKEIADEADRRHAQPDPGARDATDRYIAAHRLRVDGEGGACRAAPAAENHRAEVPAGLPSDAVLVSAGDMQACSAAVKYGLDARDFVLTLAAAQIVNEAE